MVHLVPVLWVGGLERVATTLVLAVSERGARVVVASHGGEPFEPGLLAAAIPFVRIPRPRMEARLFPSATLSFARLLRRERPDVVHAHNPIAATTAALARLISYSRRTRIVSTYHGLVNPDGVKRAARAL